MKFITWIKLGAKRPRCGDCLVNNLQNGAAIADLSMAGLKTVKTKWAASAINMINGSFSVRRRPPHNTSGTTLIKCWSKVCDVGPIVNQRGAIKPCFSCTYLNVNHDWGHIKTAQAMPAPTDNEPMPGLSGGNVRDDGPALNQQWIRVSPANTKHLYNICTTPAQRLRRWYDVVQMLYL